MFRQRISHITRAYAQISGGSEYPSISAAAEFTNRPDGTLVTVRANGLPSEGVFGFHIHEGVSCANTGGGEFSGAGSHYNPTDKKHPYHAGDLPPLFSTKNGEAYISFLTDRFSIKEIVGKTMIIHSGRDDFSDNPSGNSGARIACGVITMK